MKIAVIGAGIAGLRAALELAPDHMVTIFEKSAGVGGRVATRRFGEVPVNHGAKSFDRYQNISNDPIAEILQDRFSFTGPATNLPKTMRDIFLDFGGIIHLRTRIERFMDHTLFLEGGSVANFDRYIFTAPVPQIREMFQENILPEVTYSKAILFIGNVGGKPTTQFIPQELADKIFDLTDEEIRSVCPKEFENLELKKWRYARVEKGVSAVFHKHHPEVILAGEAFDPSGIYDLSSAWNSGRFAGSEFV